MTPEGKALLRRLCPHEPAWRTHVDLVSGVEAAAVAEADTLDVERLARAIHYATLPPEYVATLPANYPIAIDLTNAPRIATEYAALVQHTEEKE